MGLTTDVPEHNGSVQACVNITQGSVESGDNFVLTYISTSTLNESGSAVGMNLQLQCMTLDLLM